MIFTTQILPLFSTKFARFQDFSIAAQKSRRSLAVSLQYGIQRQISLDDCVINLVSQQIDVRLQSGAYVRLALPVVKLNYFILIYFVLVCGIESKLVSFLNHVVNSKNDIFAYTIFYYSVTKLITHT